MKRLTIPRPLRPLTLLTAIALVLGIVALTRQASGADSATPAPSTLPVQAYMVATGTFAQPAAGTAPADFVVAQDAAAAAHSALAFTIWVDQESFETRGWRDLLQVGRIP